MNKLNYDNTERRDWILYKIETGDIRLSFDREKAKGFHKVNVEALDRNTNLLYQNYGVVTGVYFGIAAGRDRIDSHLKGTDDIEFFACFLDGYEPKVTEMMILKNMTYKEAEEIETMIAWDASKKKERELEKHEVTFVCGPYYDGAKGCQRVFPYPDNPKGYAPKCMQDVFGKEKIEEIISPIVAAKGAIVDIN